MAGYRGDIRTSLLHFSLFYHFLYITYINPTITTREHSVYRFIEAVKNNLVQ